MLVLDDDPPLLDDEGLPEDEELPVAATVVGPSGDTPGEADAVDGPAGEPETVATGGVDGTALEAPSSALGAALSRAT
jgi:hypothetical protein